MNSTAIVGEASTVVPQHQQKSSISSWTSTATDRRITRPDEAALTATANRAPSSLLAGSEDCQNPKGPIPSR